MTASTTMSIRVSPETKRKLERIAGETRRSKSFLAAEAVSAYVAGRVVDLPQVPVQRKAVQRRRRFVHRPGQHGLFAHRARHPHRLRRGLRPRFGAVD
ncbi:CopG family ribbon-helix-helix protein [Paracoccus mutanolyticus]|uniref:CopG family ribbon-helix-helix protein n=1 Tax=Paracoccus mutanolyticus TaxID=1499308 RepID=UPI001CB95199|nr:ribbon-helix-helix domain-containing protein [Paracoccus mutanolyticus]